MAVDLSGKRLELLKEAVPNLSRVALLSDPTTASSKERVIKANQAAANALGISLWPAEITAPDQIEPVFSKITRPPIDHVHGPLHGLDVEPVQKLLEGLTKPLGSNDGGRPLCFRAIHRRAVGRLGLQWPQRIRTRRQP
jgi:hypothetical protein